MHFEPRLWEFTRGVRWRIAYAVAVGLAAVGFGIVRLALLGWLIAQVYNGAPAADLIVPIAVIALTMVGRGLFEQWRAMVAHTTAALVQRTLRRRLMEKLTELGPGYVGARRSGDLTTILVDGVEHLETYFGKFIPQFLVTVLTPVLIFALVAVLDPWVAGAMVAFAFLAVFLPGLWHNWNTKSSKARSEAYSAFASELLDSIQGLATLKAFGRSQERAASLEEKADRLSKTTLWVLGANTMARGISDAMIALGAASALVVGAYRVDAGLMELTALLMIMMTGIEMFRPMRDLRTVLHEGMLGLSASHAIYSVLDARPPLEDPSDPVERALEPSVTFEGVHFAYPGTSRSIHEGLDLEIKPGERIGIVGPSGAGKSSIVRLLMRFFDPDQGVVRIGGVDLKGLPFDAIRSRIAVVQQDAFLFHGTIGQNIRFGRPDASEADLIAAAQAANIHDFVSGLPDGYDTMVGEKGIKLSGGQRQRVAIARAILRDAPILVLDEALSAVDAENETAIQAALDTLMKDRTTLVLAHRLSSVIDCDRIVVLDGGRVIEEGRHAALMAKGGVYATLMAEQARDAERGDDVFDPPIAETDKGDREAEGQTAAASILGAPTEGIVAASGLGWGKLTVLLLAMILPWWRKMGFTLFCGITRVLAFIGVGVVSALIVMALKRGEPFGHLVPWLFVLAPLAGLLHWLESWLAHEVAFELLAKMRIRVFNLLDKLAPAYLVRRRTGDLMGIATHDIELVEYFFAHTVVPAIVSLLVPGTVLLVLASYDPLLALTLIPFLLAVAVSPWLMRGRVDKLGSDAREAAGELAAHAVDSIQGLGEIVANRREDDRVREFDHLSERHAALRLPFFRELTWQSSLLEILTGLGGLAIVTMGAIRAGDGAIDPTVLPLLTLLALSSFLPISEIAEVGRQLADTLGATRRVHAVEVEEPVVADTATAKQAPAPTGGGAAMALENVRFLYPGTSRPALDDVSFAASPGQTVALVGPSGAGKTTVAQILMRFWDPEEGRVTLDGQDLRDLTLTSVRERTALVAQETYLFNDTLDANIRIARPDASEADVAAAIDNAALGDLLEQLPDGLATIVGERGSRLSGGQRQRVAIARAFLKDAPVLILDEATSHLDAVNERLVREALDRLRAGRTTFVIAHRLSTVREADLIVVLDKGRVMESGSHDALLNAGGLYARLVSRQLASGKGKVAAE